MLYSYMTSQYKSILMVAFVCNLHNLILHCVGVHGDIFVLWYFNFTNKKRKNYNSVTMTTRIHLGYGLSELSSEIAVNYSVK